MVSALSRLLCLIGLACLASAARAEDRATPIRDDAGLFHAEAVARAEKGIADIRRRFDRNLFVRTVALTSPRKKQLPWWQQFRWFFKPRKAMNRILEEQARKIADSSGADGIYVVICTAPRDVHVIVRPGDDPLFSTRDAETLRKSSAWHLSEKGADAALLSVVKQVDALLQTHAKRGRLTSVVNEIFLAAILVGGVALWLILYSVRLKLRAGHLREEDAAKPARGTPALLGAQFGFPAALWIYDKLHPR